MILSTRRHHLATTRDHAACSVLAGGRALVFAALLSLSLILSATAGAACRPPIKGFLPLLAKPIVIALGEVHGTREVPATVEQLACTVTHEGLPLVIGYEIAGSEQPRIRAFVASDGGPSARQALLQSEFWQTPYKDGRQSRGLLHLLDYVRRLRRGGANVDFVAIDTGTPGDDRDANMAAGVLDARAQHPDAVILVVAGNNHTRVDQSWAMGARLRRQGVALVSLNVDHDSGTMWSCINQCGLHAVEGRARGSSAFIELTPAGTQMFDGRLYIGALTGSPPAFPDGAP